jgi:hypothetical protein
MWRTAMLCTAASPGAADVARVASAQTSLLPVVAGKPKHDSSFKGGKYAESETRRD